MEFTIQDTEVSDEYSINSVNDISMLTLIIKRINLIFP